MSCPKENTIRKVESAIAMKEPDEESAKKLTLSVDRIYDETNKLARSRNGIIADREQMTVLSASLNAIRSGNMENAMQILEERLKKISRRISLRESDEDDENSTFREQFQQPSVLPSNRLPQIFDSNISIDDWIELCGGILSIGCNSDEAPVAPTIPDDLSQDRAALQRQGYLHGDTFEPATSLSEPILKVCICTHHLHRLPPC
jgi:hypothetical protein